MRCLLHCSLWPVLIGFVWAGALFERPQEPMMMIDDELVVHDQHERWMNEMANPNASYKWPKAADGLAHVPWYFNKTAWPGMPPADNDIFELTLASTRRASQFYANFTCVRLDEGVPPGTVDYVNVYSNNAGMGLARVGRQGGAQFLLSPFFFDASVHEFAHVLGFQHTNLRWDSKDYVFGNLSNVLQRSWGAVWNFSTENYNVPYDYGSLLHPPATSFAITKAYPVLVALDPYYQRTMGQFCSMSFFDLYEMNLHYNCTANCDGRPSASCLHGGYPNPNDCQKCVCPIGFAGQLCADVDAGDTAQCSSKKLLAATSEWQNLQFEMTIPNVTVASCFWQITSPASTVIQVQMVEMKYGYGCYTGQPSGYADLGFVEFKTRADQRYSGYRQCCMNISNCNPAQEFALYTSEANLVMILAHAGVMAPHTEFTMKYRSVPKYHCQSADWQVFDNRCYRLFDQTMNYEAAIKQCSSVGAKMPSIRTAEENFFIGAMLGRAYKSHMWLGISLNGTNRVWTDGTPFTYSNFFSNFESNVVPMVFASVPHTWYAPFAGKWLPIDVDNQFPVVICWTAAILG